jgi:hypothetical protein
MAGVGQHDEEIHFRANVDKICRCPPLGVPDEPAVGGDRHWCEKGLWCKFRARAKNGALTIASSC